MSCLISSYSASLRFNWFIFSVSLSHAIFKSSWMGGVTYPPCVRVPHYPSCGICLLCRLSPSKPFPWRPQSVLWIASGELAVGFACLCSPKSAVRLPRLGLSHSKQCSLLPCVHLVTEDPVTTWASLAWPGFSRWLLLRYFKSFMKTYNNIRIHTQNSR